MKRWLILITIIILILNITSCNIDYKPSFVSHNINESKSKGIFICEYKIIKNDLANKIGFNYNKIWIEKRWSSYLDKDGNEKFNVQEDTFQLIINFKDNHLFSNNTYFYKYIIQDDKANVLAGTNSLLILDSDTLKFKPEVIKLLIVKLKYPFHVKLETTTIGELLLKKL